MKVFNQSSNKNVLTTEDLQKNVCIGLHEEMRTSGAVDL